ncbi:MAG TPA: hypothetical protein VER55_08380, partial [Ardenticatenaceae bacterium]|nr:hypothetical protein [Ardenticatenaceae bacterium]
MRRLPAAILALLGYLALSLLLTWPLARHLTTHAPGNGTDDPAILWNLWWVRFSLTVLHQNPFQSDFLFWPLGINLVFYTLTVLNALLSIPVQLSVGLVAANSFVVLFELSIAGLGMFLLAAHLLARHNDLWGLSRSTRAAVAFVAGAAFTFAASRFVYLSLGQYNIAASHWVPWMVLAAVRLGDTPDGARRRRAALLAGLFLLFNGWTEFTYASFLLIFLGLLWAWHALWSLRSGRWRRVVQISIGYLAVILLFLAGMSPILWQMFQDLRTEGDFLVEGLGFANVFSNDLLGFLVPTHLHPIFGRVVAEGLDFAYLNFAYIGWALVLLAGVALLGRARGAGAFWAAGAIVFGLLSLGPTLRLNGRELDLPLPFDLLLQLPFFKANRYPSRYSVMIALCLAVLSAYGLATLVRWLGRDIGGRRGRTWVGPAVNLTALVLVL